uniref:Putative secreted protein n=1 Tax=Ixodes ricinus TaxID=34613 RepID=A0A6B0U2E2_IXORI
MGKRTRRRMSKSLVHRACAAPLSGSPSAWPSTGAPPRRTHASPTRGTPPTGFWKPSPERSMRSSSSGCRRCVRPS